MTPDSIPPLGKGLEGVTTSHDIDTGKKYHVLMELGRGGTAIVSAGIARGIGNFSKLVVLKRIKEEVLGERETVKMFVNEARLSARMNHPNVVQVYEVYRESKLPVIVMEYLDGQSLAKLYSRAVGDRAFSIEMAITIVCQVLAGLHYAHDLADYDGTPFGIVHRDVSPHNVMLTYGGQVKLLDFGIAKLANGPEDTRTGVVKGKVGYMPPEQLEALELDRRADIFAVGVILWELTSRARLWGNRSDVEIIRCLVCDEIPKLPQRIADAEPELARIVHKAIASAPGQRFATAAEFQLELERLLATRGSVPQQSQIAELMETVFGDLRTEARDRLKQELARVEASPGWDNALQAFDNAQTPQPDKPRTLLGSRLWLGLASGALAIATAFAVFSWVSSAEPGGAVAASPPAPDALRGDAPSAKQVSLDVSVTPVGASLLLDGRPLGSAPLQRSLVSDSELHELRVEAPGYQPRSQHIWLATNLELQLSLTPLPAAAKPAPIAPPAEPPIAKRPRPARPPPTPAPSPPPPAVPRTGPNAPGCSPPYYISADGLKHYRRECL
jgi:serine/threonine protein kinase